MPTRASLTAELDVTGLRCPLPVLKARPFLRRLAPGAHAVIKADDPLARVDLPDLCRQEGHTVLSEQVENGVIVFEIETGQVRTLD